MTTGAKGLCMQPATTVTGPDQSQVLPHTKSQDSWKSCPINMRLPQSAVLCRIEQQVHFFEKGNRTSSGRSAIHSIEARNATSPSWSNLCGFGIRLVWGLSKGDAAKA